MVVQGVARFIIGDAGCLSLPLRHLKNEVFARGAEDDGLKNNLSFGVIAHGLQHIPLPVLQIKEELVRP
jgi:hypothetical protein